MFENPLFSQVFGKFRQKLHALSLNPCNDFVLPDSLDDSEKALINTLVVDETIINNIEEATRANHPQSSAKRNASSDLWYLNLI